MLCEECKNNLEYETNRFSTSCICIFGVEVNDAILKCSHFKAKPKDNKELQSKEQKALLSKTKGFSGTYE